MARSQQAAIYRSRKTLSSADLPPRRKEVCVPKPPAALRPETVQQLMDRMDFTSHNIEADDRGGEPFRAGVWA